MGQYHSIYNKTKKQAIHPHHLGDGTKLREFCESTTMAGLALLLSNSNGRGGGDFNIPYEYNNSKRGHKRPTGTLLEMETAIAAVAGLWAGDEIVIQGDYVEKGDPSFIPEKELEGYRDVSDIVVRALSVYEEYNEKLRSGYLEEKYCKKNLLDLKKITKVWEKY